MVSFIDCAGTRAPICAMMTRIHACLATTNIRKYINQRILARKEANLKRVDLPPMFGPVTRQRTALASFVPREMSLGMTGTPLRRMESEKRQS